MHYLIVQAEKYTDRVAIATQDGSCTYGELLRRSSQFASSLLELSPDLSERRIAFMITPGIDYVTVQWGIWRAGGIAVPLCLAHPLPAITYVVEDTGADTIVVSPQYESLIAELAREKGLRLIVLGNEPDSSQKELPHIALSRRAMILYTSGTTSLPKGVVTTHQNLRAQIESLVHAWDWSADDAILNVLPLHHVHGIVNVVCCALYSGGCCWFVPGFDASAIFEVFIRGNINLFMAVPTIYYKLIAYYESMPTEAQSTASEAMKKFRLMVSGSAALPVTTMERWQKISGHTLLERYGMTEIGMAISNPYAGERRAGVVGMPLPGVHIRLVDEDYHDVGNASAGEVLVQGGNVFHEYWNKPDATAAAFTADGWFKTGDVAILDNGYYKIMGRNSVDIIKSGGYKISALEIEEVLRGHAGVKDCAVVGLENEEWGELVAAAIVPVADERLDTDVLDRWMREQLPAYRVPRRYQFMEELPRNAMGKVLKNDLKKMF